jgi:hypothetical protein
MRRVKITFKLVYNDSLLASKEQERAPVAMVWNSMQNRSKTSFALVVPAGQHESQPKEMYTTFDAPTVSEKTVSLLRDDTIGVRIKVHSPNDQGVLSLANCGDNLFPIGAYLCDMQKKGMSVAAANKQLGEEEVPIAFQFHVFFDENGGAVVKGAALISNIAAFDAATGAPLLLSVDEKTNENAFLPENEKFFSATIDNVLYRSIMPFTEQAVATGIEFRASTDESKRVHAPVFALPSGMVPGFAYILKPGPQAPTSPAQFTAVQAYMRKLIDYALVRESQSPQWFIDTVNAQLARTDNTYDDNFTACAALVGQMLVIPSTSEPYVSDTVNTSSREKVARIRTNKGFVDFQPSQGKHGVHGVERFSEVAENKGGDCEDVAMLINRVAVTLANGAWTDPLVTAAARVVQQYVPVVSLGSVKDASVGNDLTDTKKLAGAGIIDSPADLAQSYGAHMWSEAVPVVKFFAQVQRAVPDVNADLLWTKGAVKAPWTAALPQLVLEGTGRISSLQLPAAAYVTGKDNLAERKQKTAAAVEKRHKLISSILSSTDVFKKMQMVRDQPATELTPNMRVTNFYRNATHIMTSAFLQNGLATVDFLPANRGERVPMQASVDKFYSNNIVAMSMCAPIDGAQKPVAASAVDYTSWSERASFHAPGPQDMMHAGQAEAVRLLNADTRFVSAAADASAPASRKPAQFKYGVPMFDRLQSPMLPATCLVPSSPITQREALVIATVMRHAPPITMPGDWAEIEMLEAACLESRLKNDGDDEAAALKLEDERFAKLEADIRATMGFTETAKSWPKRGSHVGKFELVSFFFPYGALRSQKNVDDILADVRKKKADGTFAFVRLLSENPMPGRRDVLLQAMCPYSTA